MAKTRSSTKPMMVVGFFVIVAFAVVGMLYRPRLTSFKADSKHVKAAPCTEQPTQGQLTADEATKVWHKIKYLESIDNVFYFY